MAGFASAAKAQAPFLVVDMANGNVLLSEDATRPWNPASTTKMMTAYVALRAVKAGQLTLDTPLIASANAARQKPSKLGIRPGQEITLDNALKVLMVKSANDLAVVVAEALGGSVDGFSAMMNTEARRLGMNESRFMNPHGFHLPGHQTSARDLAVLAMAMLREFPEHRDYWGIGAVQFGNRVLNNTNGLIGRYPGATGFKTGFVCASGFNLVSTATRGGRTLITVVLGASSGGERVARSAQLLDQGFASWNGNGQTLQTLPASGLSNAPDMRNEICGSGRRKGVILADDSDYSGSLIADSVGGESMAGGSALAFFATQSTPAVQRSVGVRSTSGRAVLGPRTGITPVAVYLGRAPGSTAVALGPGGRRTQPVSVAATPPAGGIPGLPASASALAPTGLRTSVPGFETPASQAAIRPAAARAASPQPTEQRNAPAGNGPPLQLPGVITSGPKPGAAAAIRPRQAAVSATAQPKAKAGVSAKAESSAKDKAPAKPKELAKAKTSPKAAPLKKKKIVDDE
ncbi:MAG: serine hydrolase [Beijerinckiaceae bacterium]